MLQSLFEGPSRLYANSFSTVQRRKRDNCVPGDMVFPADEPHPWRNTERATKGVELGNRYDVLSHEENQDEGFAVMLMDAIKPPSKNKLKK